MTDPTTNEPTDDGDEKEPTDMSEFVRKVAAATGSLYVNFVDGTIRHSGDPLTDDTPPAA